MLLGDGCLHKWYTTSVKLADQFQQLCLHSGWACMIQREVHDILRLSVLTNRLDPCVNPCKVQEEKFVEEKCPVYCLQVSSGIFYVRRNGKSIWTGNCIPSQN